MACAGKPAALPKARNDIHAARQFIHRITRCGMRLHRQDLAEDAKGADAMTRAEFQRGQQRLGVGATQIGQPRQPLRLGQAQHRRSRCGTELDWLAHELAAQAEPQGVGLRWK